MQTKEMNIHSHLISFVCVLYRPCSIMNSNILKVAYTCSNVSCLQQDKSDYMCTYTYMCMYKLINNDNTSIH